jgi:predicted nuclease with TOPRIM domain
LAESFKGMTFQELQAKYEEALLRVEELEKENARLKKVLREHHINVDDVEVSLPAPKKVLSVEERVELFRSLFKGRRMCLPEDGKVKRKLVISQRVRMNGIGSCAIRKSTDAQSVPTTCFFR